MQKANKMKKTHKNKEDNWDFTDAKLAKYFDDNCLKDDWLRTLMTFALHEYGLWPTNMKKTFNPELIDFGCLILEWVGFVNYVRFYEGGSLEDFGEWVHTPRLERAMNKQLKRWKETYKGFERRELKKHLKK